MIRSRLNQKGYEARRIDFVLSLAQAFKLGDSPITALEQHWQLRSMHRMSAFSGRLLHCSESFLG